MFIKTAAKFYSIVYLLTCNCLGDDFMALETAVLDVVGNDVVMIGSIGSAEARIHQFFEEESRTK